MIHLGSCDTFLRQNIQKYPNPDSDFILQICFEHPERFNVLLPAFDPERHSAFRIQRTLRWVYDNVRYDGNQELDFWYEQFDSFRKTDNTSYWIYAHMIKVGTWPFPPVIIESNFAITLGASEKIGKPYHLIEGTHRVSYARRMLIFGLVDCSRSVDIIEIRPH